jgi:hypothetical protein
LGAFKAGDRDAVLAALDRMAVRLIGLSDNIPATGADVDFLQKD